jgi:DNA polymerase III alpha subunit
LESLAKSGSFDTFGDIHRAQYFYKKDEDSPNLIGRLVKWINNKNFGDAAQVSLFDTCEDLKQEEYPIIPVAEPWTNIEQAEHEKEVIGFYVSGHPLNDYDMEIKYFTNTAVTELNNLDELKNKREITFAGILREVTHAQSKTGSPFGKFTIEDLEGTHTMTIFSKTYTSMKLKSDDRIVRAEFIKEKNILITKTGYYLNYNIDEIPVAGVKASGVKGINLKDDELVSGIPFDESDEYLTIFTNRNLCIYSFGNYSTFICSI